MVESSTEDRPVLPKEATVPHPTTHDDAPRGRPYLSAMSHPRLLPLYDAFTRLAGVRSTQWRLVAQAGIAPGATVLEIGAGTGTVLLLAKRAVGTATVTGLDPDPRALAIAHRRAAREGVEVRLDHGYADRLPYADGSVDRVLSAFMLHHLPGAEKAAALREAHRVLAPGGSLHIVDLGGEQRGVVGRLLHRSHRAGRVEQDAARDHGHHGDQGPAPLRGPEIAAPHEVVRLLREAGFAEPGPVGQGRTAVGGVTFYRAAR